MIIITNSLSLGMLSGFRLRGYSDETGDESICTTQISVTTVPDPVTWLAEAERDEAAAVSAVGHSDTAALYSRLLSRHVAANRASIKIEEGDVLLIGQYSGPRLPEGSTELPDGAEINWVSVEILSG